MQLHTEIPFLAHARLEGISESDTILMKNEIGSGKVLDSPPQESSTLSFSWSDTVPTL